MAREKYQRKDGTFCRTFIFNGKRYCVYGRNKTELEKKFKNKKKEVISGKKEKDNPKIESFFNTWQDNRRGYVKEATLRSQQCHFNTICNIKVNGKPFKDYRLSEVRAEDIRIIQRTLLKKNTERTVNDKIAFLSHIFHDAIREQYISYNPCSPVRNLKIRKIEARKTYHRALTKEETRVFFEEAKDNYYYDVFCFAIQTGMRAGEIGALKYCDIYNDEIHIERTITRTENGGYCLGEEPKTRHGKRIIPLNNAINKILERKKIFLDSNDDLIFKAPKNGLLVVTPIDRAIKKICRKAGINDFTFHAFRDTFATRAIENGVPPRVLQDLLGHADYDLTMNLYVHVCNDSLMDAMDKILIEY